MTRHTRFVVDAAGGNATAIHVIDNYMPANWYEAEGRQMMSSGEPLGVEQAGFLIPDKDRFEMSGGEFCGNAARAAAMLLSRIKEQDEFDFTMSGTSGPVHARVIWDGDKKADVTCTFSDLESKKYDVKTDKHYLTVVDLGGIVHLMVKGEMPKAKEDYEALHRELRDELMMNDRSAVGVCWMFPNGDSVRIDPVVWVKAIDSFFYEGACGSGSIAAALVTNQTKIVQPTGQVIDVVQLGDNKISLHSNMEITDEQ